MANQPFEVQNDISMTGNITVAAPKRVSDLQAAYDEAIYHLTDAITTWEDDVFTASNNSYTIPPRYKVADYTTYDRLINVSSNDAWNWTGGYSPEFAEFYDLVNVSAPSADLITKANAVKQAYAALQAVEEQYKYIKPQATTGDGARALDITAGSATWTFDLDNTWAQSDFTTRRQGRLTLPNGASITGNSADIEAARQAVLDYNAGWKRFCDEQNRHVDVYNRLNAIDPENNPNIYTPYFWLNTDLLTTADQTEKLVQLTALWQSQQGGGITHLPISSAFYQQMRAYLALGTIETYETLLASTDINTGDYKFTFRSSDGALVLTEGGAIKSSDDTSITDAQDSYDQAAEDWITLRADYITQATDNGITSTGWPFIEWVVDGEDAASRLAELEAAWDVQQFPSSPPQALIWAPAISAQTYTDIFNAITLIDTTYTTWQNLKTGVDIVTGSSRLSLLADDKLQVPGIIQTDVEEDLIIRARYAAASSPSGTTTANKDYIFGTNGTLTFVGGGAYDATIQGDASGNLNLTANGYVNIESSSYAAIKLAIDTANSSVDMGNSTSPVRAFGNLQIMSGRTLTFADSTVQSTAYVKTTGTWTVTSGTNNYSFTVPANGAYQLWVRGNIPNGIISYIATVHVTNPNVPVLGTQRAWNYTGAGDPILLTSLPSQIIGTEGVISTGTISGTTNNIFVFGISNSSGSDQTVSWGYINL